MGVPQASPTQANSESVRTAEDDVAELSPRPIRQAMAAVAQAATRMTADQRRQDPKMPEARRGSAPVSRTRDITPAARLSGTGGTASLSSAAESARSAFTSSRQREHTWTWASRDDCSGGDNSPSTNGPNFGLRVRQPITLTSSVVINGCRPKIPRWAAIRIGLLFSPPRQVAI